MDCAAWAHQRRVCHLVGSLIHLCIERMEVDISERLTADVVPRVGVGSSKVEWLPAILDAAWTKWTERKSAKGREFPPSKTEPARDRQT